jgi:hypothetical protein
VSYEFLLSNFVSVKLSVELFLFFEHGAEFDIFSTSLKSVVSVD